MILADNQTPTPTRLLNKCEELRVFDDPYVQNLNPFDEGFRQAISCENRESFLTTTHQSQDTLHTPQIIPDFITRPLKEESQTVQEEPENLSLTPDTIPRIVVSNVEVSKPIAILPKPSVIYATSTTQLQTVGDDRSNVRDKLKSVILGGSSSDTKRVKLTENDTKLKLPAILIATPIITASGNMLINNTVGKIKKEVKSEEKNSENGANVRRKSECSKVERNRAAARRYR